MAKILVIEDEQDIRLHLLKILEYEGFEGIGAENGHIGIQLAKEHLPDLILCDVVMPGISGYRVLSELRSDPVMTTIPFIFLTAKAAQEHVRKGMSLGADDYLTKPFELDELLTAIKTRLEKYAAVAKQMADLHANLRSILPHELWAPLAGMLTFSELLKDADKLFEPKEIAEMGSIIHANSVRLERLIENYFMYTELMLMKHHPERKNAWQAAEVVNTKDFIAFFANYKAVEVRREDDMIVDLVDTKLQIAPNILQKIVVELLDNAFKFSKPGTSVHVVTYGNATELVLNISDHGCGMTNEEIGNIGAFRQFKSNWYEHQGAGLGLIISHLLVQLHGGTLTVKSTPNEGTSVIVVFVKNGS
jgi:two-component system sensor histidine kinase/response regulator